MLSKKYNNFVFVADGWKRKYNNNYKLKREILAKTNSIKKKINDDNDDDDEIKKMMNEY